MGRSNETFKKKEKEKKKRKKKEEKAKRREERKEEGGNKSFEDMIAYVDEYGNIVDTPPEKKDDDDEIEAEDIVLGVPKKGEIEEVPNEGKVSYFDHSKGYGFIQHDHTSEKHFVHISQCIDEIEEDDKVTFDLERGDKGMNAVQVKRKK